MEYSIDDGSLSVQPASFANRLRAGSDMKALRQPASSGIRHPFPPTGSRG
jgi:hypothetical protein